MNGVLHLFRDRETLNAFVLAVTVANRDAMAACINGAGQFDDPRLQVMFCRLFRRVLDDRCDAANALVAVPAELALIDADIDVLFAEVRALCDDGLAADVDTIDRLFEAPAAD